MTASRIIGTGHYVPSGVVINFDVMKMMVAFGSGFVWGLP